MDQLKQGSRSESEACSSLLAIDFTMNNLEGFPLNLELVHFCNIVQQTEEYWLRAGQSVCLQKRVPASELALYTYLHLRTNI